MIFLRACFYFEFYCWGNFNFKGICYKGLFFFHSLHICLCHGKSKGASRNFSETDISFHMILILAFSMKVTKLIKEIQKINMPKCVSTCFSPLTVWVTHIVSRVLLQKKCKTIDLTLTKNGTNYVTSLSTLKPPVLPFSGGQVLE